LFNFIKLLLNHIDEKKNEFEQFEINFKSLDNENFKNSCLKLAEGIKCVYNIRKVSTSPKKYY
jgi:hypothetical protein